MHQVCSHDLPNQAVALQSLLQLFAWDETEQLSPQGREYFERLQSIAAKAGILIQYLRDLARLQRYVPRWENLFCAQLAQELRAEVRRAFPDHAWSWDCHWRVEAVAADRRLLLQGLSQLARFAVLAGAGGAPRVEMTTAPHPDHIAWTVTVRTARDTAPSPASFEAASIEQPLAWALAQEFLAATEIACRPAEGAAAGALTFTLMFPQRSPHG